jgi:hypothetical protein
MDRLGGCIDGLRILARTQDPNHVSLVQRRIDQYLKNETSDLSRALERLRQAIQDEIAERRSGENGALLRNTFAQFCTG